MTDVDLYELAKHHIQRANAQPDPFTAARDMNTGAMLMIVFELRRIASTLSDIKVMALAEGEQ